MSPYHVLRSLVPSTRELPRVRRPSATLLPLVLLAAPLSATQDPCGVQSFLLGAIPPADERLAVASDGDHIAVVRNHLPGVPTRVRVLRRNAATGNFSLDTELGELSWPPFTPLPRLDVDRGALAAVIPGYGTWIYRQGAQGWSLEQELPDLQPSEHGALRLFGDTLFVATDTGVAIVERGASTGTWSRTATLTTTGGTGGDFGFDIDFDGRLLAIGAPTENAVDLFIRDTAGTWRQLDRLEPDSANTTGFGTNVEVEDLVVIVGSSVTSADRTIRVFRRHTATSGTWGVSDRVPVPIGMTTGSQFGRALQYSRGTLAVSAPLHPVGGSGRILLFREQPLSRLFRPEAAIYGANFPLVSGGLRFGARMFLRDGLLLASYSENENSFSAHVPGTTDCDLDGTADICQIRGGAAFDDNHNGFLDTCELSGQRYCSPNVPNSSGVAARLGIFGFPRVLLFSMEFHVGGLPEGALAYMLASRASQAVANPAQWLGDLCVGGSAPISRGLGGIRSADRDGRYFFSHNRPVIPFGAGLAPILPGDTWHFQCWYQDPAAVPRSNFSDAVAVTFTFL